MITRVVMPKLTDTMEEGVVVAWKKHEGDAVDSGDILAEIETDKAVLDLESFGSGVLRKVLVPEGETVKAGKLIAVIGEQDDDIEATLAETSEDQAAAPEPQKDSAPPPKEKPSQPSPEPSIPTKGEKSGSAKKEAKDTKADSSQDVRIKVSPRAKALAKEQGIDLSTIKGSGPEGRIVEADIQGRVDAPKVLERKTKDIPLSQMRKAIARVTTSSKAPVPHFYLTTEVAMDQAERLRKQMEELGNGPLSLTVLFVRAAALALARHPEMNVSFMGEVLRRHATIDIGIAVALEEGLITPVIRDCAGKNILQVAEEIRDLFVRAKSQQLTPEEYAGATFSISNLGMYEVDNFIAVLMPPQAASLAIGAVNIVPVARGRAIKLSRRMKVTLSCDHRALDGAQGARFLQSFKRALEKPLELFLPLKTRSKNNHEIDQ
ncbi:dihydrolipoamide acetyltransferase family protein [uncultured Nitrospira sp.]|uniref:dihydrolipoamide acetyltransferase family protein n=1 Tax=uncultured Nitrospira sp. TaxID=157176 RepID=UPI003140C0B7